MRPLKKFTISAQCHAFAAHLAKSATPETFKGRHEAMDADPQDLKKWKISRREWSLAYAAAAEAKRTGQDPEDFLKSTAKFFNSRTTDSSATEVFGLSLEVGGAGQR